MHTRGPHIPPTHYDDYDDIDEIDIVDIDEIVIVNIDEIEIEEIDDDIEIDDIGSIRGSERCCTY